MNDRFGIGDDHIQKKGLSLQQPPFYMWNFPGVIKVLKVL